MLKTHSCKWNPQIVKPWKMIIRPKNISSALSIQISLMAMVFLSPLFCFRSSTSSAAKTVVESNSIVGALAAIASNALSSAVSGISEGCSLKAGLA